MSTSSSTQTHVTEHLGQLVQLLLAMVADVDLLEPKLRLEHLIL